MPASMKAIQIPEFGGPEVLELTERPIPEPGADEVLIQVVAAGVNRPDSLQRQGRHPPPAGASDIPGLDVAGKVIALGSDVSEPHEGDMVCALVPGGGYAEYCVAHHGQCLPVPDGMEPHAVGRGRSDTPRQEKSRQITGKRKYVNNRETQRRQRDGDQRQG